jgi:hypothetical protein
VVGIGFFLLLSGRSSYSRRDRLDKARDHGFTLLTLAGSGPGQARPPPMESIKA